MGTLLPPGSEEARLCAGSVLAPELS